jgi:predicted 3-demethylubiquinone-9 3-methyltransferase (glyoxalase superfamily)
MKTPTQKITPYLWFDNNMEEALAFYTTIFKDSKILNMHHFPKEVADGNENLMTAIFQLEGQQFMAINGGPMFKFNNAVSLFVKCSTQEEIDYYWEKLLEGGKEQQCGWLTDQFGLSWQIIPDFLEEATQSSDTGKAVRVMKAMMEMQKIDLQALKDAAGE